MTRRRAPELPPLHGLPEAGQAAVWPAPLIDVQDVPPGLEGLVISPDGFVTICADGWGVAVRLDAGAAATLAGLMVQLSERLAAAEGAAGEQALRDLADLIDNPAQGRA